MTKTWTKTLPRTFRPYFEAADLQTVLDAAEIVLRPGDEPFSETRTILPGVDMVGLDPTVHPRIDALLLRETLGVRASSFDLVLTVRTPQMLRRVLAGRWPCDTVLPEAIPVPFEALDDARLSGLVHIGLAICLRDDVPAHVGWPAFAGSRLAFKSFEIGVDRRMSSFSFDELTPERRKSYGVPDGTAFILQTDELVEPIEDGQVLGAVFVEPGLLAALRNGSIGAVGNAVLVSDIFDALMEAVARVEADADVQPGSGLERILEWAAEGGTAMSWKAFRAIVADPQRRRAFVQDRLGFADTLRRIK